jgi:hypothetical protein
VRCALEQGHHGSHWAVGRNGLGDTWSDAQGERADADDEMSLDELLSWLADLAATARAEGFAMFASTLEKQRALIDAHRSVYTPTSIERLMARRELAAAASSEKPDGK